MGDLKQVPIKSDRRPKSKKDKIVNSLAFEENEIQKKKTEKKIRKHVTETKKRPPANLKKISFFKKPIKMLHQRSVLKTGRFQESLKARNFSLLKSAQSPFLIDDNYKLMRPQLRVAMYRTQAFQQFKTMQ